MGHKTQKELEEILLDANKLVAVGEKYFHYKHPDKHYIVEGLEIREETETVSVRYKALHDKGIVWNRLLSEWLKPAEIGGEQIPRFKRV